MGALNDRLIAASLRHRLVVIGATLVLAAVGTWAFATLNTDAFPDLTPNQVLVMTESPGLSPVEVEQQVTYPMEVAMLGLPRTIGVRSISKVGLSVVTVTFEDDVDLYFARAQVQQRMADAKAQLPSGAEPMMGPPGTAMGEVFEYLVESTNTDTAHTGALTDSLPLINLTNIQEYTIKPLLRTVAGVASVNTWGGMLQQLQVNVDPSKLAGYGLTLDDLQRALEHGNANFGAGYVEDRGTRSTIRGLGRVNDTTDVANVVVSTRGGTPVSIRDVATVTVAPQPRFGAVTRDGRGEAVTAVVLLLKGANGREVVGRLEDRIKEIEPLLPNGVHIRPFYNQGDVVARTTHTVFRNLVEGALLVVAILLLFLRNVRASLLTASVIPLSLLAAFLAMKEFGVTANLMSLGALDFGLIVDASVVMVENFVRRLSARPDASMEEQTDIIRAAAFEVGRPIVFGIAIIVAVYIPIFTLEGIEGRMFRPMAFTVCAAVLGSLLLALTYIPAVSSLLLTRARSARSAHDERGTVASTGGHDDARWFVALRTRYEQLLGWALVHRRRVAAISVILLAAALGVVPFLGTEFMPQLDEGYLLVETRRDPSVSLGQGVAVSHDVEQTLRRFPEVANVVTNLGRPHEATETMALNQADVYVTFKPGMDGTVEDLIPRLDSALSDIPGLEFDFSAPMRMRLDEVVSGVKTELGIKLYGDSLQILQEKAEAIKEVVERVPGAEEPFVGASAGTLQLELDIDRGALARYGLTVDDVRDAMEMGIGGMEATEVINGRRRVPVVVRLSSEYRSTPEAIGQTLLRTPAGGTITLSQVARVESVEAPEVINHEGGQRYIVVQSNVRGRDLGGFVADVRRAIAEKVQLPEGYFLTYGGQFENQSRAMRRLGIIVPAVLLIIAGLLYATFGALRQVALVMLNVPFALIGGIAALWLRGIHLNLSASVGFIAVFGVAVLNGLVLVSYINQLREEGLSLKDAVREGSLTRLRPVLMTALVASFGFVPMAISTSAGAEVQRPLATVVIGGLMSATLLTLLVLPTVYAWIEERSAAGALQRAGERSMPSALVRADV